jgi:hypothetical protein
MEPPTMYGLEITARNSDIEEYVSGAVKRTERDILDMPKRTLDCEAT